MRTLSLYLRFIQIQLQAMMEYRASFLFGALAQAFTYGVWVFLIWAMVAYFGQIGGWRPYEVAFFWGLNVFSYAIAGIFCFNSFFGLGQMIRSGEFDNVLTKPLNPFLFIAIRQFNYGYFSHLTLSTLVIGLSMVRLGITLTPMGVVWLAITILSGALIYAAVFVATGVPAFWLVRNEALAAILLWDLGEFVRYPLSAFQRPLQLLFTVILPYGFVSYYPAQYFLARKDFLAFHPAVQFAAPAVGVVAITLAYLFWRFGLTRYQSTGS